ncbi:MAG: sigma-70 family RNA polymerase sigma factor [Saprospiraceae bacterium]
MDERQLWDNLRAGDKSALEACFRAYYAVLVQYASLMHGLPSSAEDLVQDLFLKLWNKRHKLPAEVSSVKPYLLRSLRNLAIDEMRKKRRGLPLIEMPFSLWGDSEQPAFGNEEESLQGQQLARALSKLSDTEREILHLRFFQQTPYPEIATVMGMQYQSVRNAAHRAIQKLRQNMEDTKKK